MVEAAEQVVIGMRLHQEFTPQTPITHKDSFQGRKGEITKIIETVIHQGAHAVIFGERGVGKTSLVGLIEQFWVDLRKDTDILTVRVNCEPKDNYITLWIQIAEELLKRLPNGHQYDSTAFTELLTQMASGEVYPSMVRQTFQSYAGFVVVIVDEFDRVQDTETVQRFADTIKGLSDYAANTTLVIVGVADNLDQLIENHASIDRSLTEIPLSRLESSDIMSIVQTRYDKVGMSYEKDAVDLIAYLARGFPYYAHLIGQSTGLAAIANERTNVTQGDVYKGLATATENAQASVRRDYYDAVSSPRVDSIHREVLLACALAKTDELGYASARDIRESLNEILGKPTDLSRCVRYLGDFASSERASVIHRKGRQRRQRYRFANPLLEVFVLFKAYQDGMMPTDQLRL